MNDFLLRSLAISSQNAFHQGFPRSLRVAKDLRGKYFLAGFRTAVAKELYEAVSVSALSKISVANSAAKASHVKADTLWQFQRGRKERRGEVGVQEKIITGKCLLLRSGARETEKE